MQTNASTRIYALTNIKKEMFGLSNGVNREIDGGLSGHINTNNAYQFNTNNTYHHRNL